MNNKTNIIAKTLIAGLACAAFCGTLTAAPRGGGKAPQKAPTHQTANVQHGHNGHGAPARDNQMHHNDSFTRHAPAPAHHEPPRQPAPHPFDNHHEDEGWFVLGASVIGGIVGGIIGACN